MNDYIKTIGLFKYKYQVVDFLYNWHGMPKNVSRRLHKNQLLGIRDLLVDFPLPNYNPDVIVALATLSVWTDKERNGMREKYGRHKWNGVLNE